MLRSVPVQFVIHTRSIATLTFGPVSEPEFFMGWDATSNLGPVFFCVMANSIFDDHVPPRLSSRNRHSFYFLFDCLFK